MSEERLMVGGQEPCMPRDEGLSLADVGLPNVPPGLDLSDEQHRRAVLGIIRTLIEMDRKYEQVRGKPTPQISKLRCKQVEYSVRAGTWDSVYDLIIEYLGENLPVLQYLEHFYTCAHGSVKGVINDKVYVPDYLTWLQSQGQEVLDLHLLRMLPGMARPGGDPNQLLGPDNRKAASFG